MVWVSGCGRGKKRRERPVGKDPQEAGDTVKVSSDMKGTGHLGKISCKVGPGLLSLDYKGKGDRVRQPLTRVNV